MPVTSMPTNIRFTGIQTRTSFHVSFSVETAPRNSSARTIMTLTKFCIINHPQKISNKLNGCNACYSLCYPKNPSLDKVSIYARRCGE